MGSLLAIWSNFYFQCFFKVILIIVLAGIIGKERDNSNKPAGFRIYTLVGLSAVLVVLCGEFLALKHNIDPFRIAAQFLSGIGFIGAGTILRNGFNVRGLTTATGLFTVSCIGLCVGAGFYFVAILASIITYFILSYSYIFTDRTDYLNTVELRLDTKDDLSDFIIELEKFTERYEIELQELEDITDINKGYNSLKVVCKYNSKVLTKNKILTKIATMQSLNGINEISNKIE